MTAGDITLAEVARSLERIEAKLDAVTGDHEQRIRTLEKWAWSIPPTLLIAAASLVAALFQ